MGDLFIEDADLERQCIIRIEDDEPYDQWPKDQLAYLVNARGGGSVLGYMAARKGWFRPAGPNTLLNGKYVTSKKNRKS